MTWDAFTKSMLLLVFASFIVERSLAVVFETKLYIDRFGDRAQLKPAIAVLYAMLFVAVVDINLVEVIRGAANGESVYSGYEWTGGAEQVLMNLLVIAMTGVFIAGGSKASLKLFRDVLGVRSSEETLRKAPIEAAPADPAKAAVAAAKGNAEAEAMLYNLLDASAVPKAGNLALPPQRLE